MLFEVNKKELRQANVFLISLFFDLGKGRRLLFNLISDSGLLSHVPMRFGQPARLLERILGCPHPKQATKVPAIQRVLEAFQRSLSLE